ncbi:hypothetical protein IAT38_002993 [Cryptococcus sp. DSM 104549]
MTFSPPHTTEISLDKLSPVHHAILEQLSLLAPTKALILSRQCLKILSPVVYRHAIASQGLIYGIFNTSSVVWTRKLEMLSHIRTLEIREMSAMWMLGRLKYPSSATNNLSYNQNVFLGVTKVLVTREVYNGLYYKTEGGVRSLVRFEAIWKDFKGQVPMVRGWEVLEDAFMETWRHRQEEYYIEDVQPAPQIVPAVIPPGQVPPPPVPPQQVATHQFQKNIQQPPPPRAPRPELTVRQATSRLPIAMLLPFLLTLFASLSGGVFHKLNLAWVATENAAVPWRIHAGVVSGCMWYNGTG